MPDTKTTKQCKKARRVSTRSKGQRRSSIKTSDVRGLFIDNRHVRQGWTDAERATLLRKA